MKRIHHIQIDRIRCASVVIVPGGMMLRVEPGDFHFIPCSLRIIRAFINGDPAYDMDELLHGQRADFSYNHEEPVE